MPTPCCLIRGSNKLRFGVISSLFDIFQLHNESRLAARNFSFIRVLSVIRSLWIEFIVGFVVIATITEECLLNGDDVLANYPMSIINIPTPAMMIIQKSLCLHSTSLRAVVKLFRAVDSNFNWDISGAAQPHRALDLSARETTRSDVYWRISICINIVRFKSGNLNTTEQIVLHFDPHIWFSSETF